MEREEQQAAIYSGFEPLLAAKSVDLYKLKYPLLGSPKFDGVRCLVLNAKPVSRKLINIPNKHIFSKLSSRLLEGFDGELGSGEPTATDFYRKTVGDCMRFAGEPDFKYYVFDVVNSNEYRDRYLELVKRVEELPEELRVLIEVVPQILLKSPAGVEEYEKDCLEAGYEGIMLRSITGPYKYGRSTVKEGTLLKVKRFEDAEAEIIGFEEQLRNDNEATKDELGHTKRSSHQANYTGLGRLGAFLVRDLKTGVEFSIGTGVGLTKELREEIWNSQGKYKTYLVKYRFFAGGSKDKPRFPVWLGFRDERDM